jgi:hypothetical protein
MDLFKQLTKIGINPLSLLENLEYYDDNITRLCPIAFINNIHSSH